MVTVYVSSAAPGTTTLTCWTLSPTVRNRSPPAATGTKLGFQVAQAVSGEILPPLSCCYTPFSLLSYHLCYPRRPRIQHDKYHIVPRPPPIHRFTVVDTPVQREAPRHLLLQTFFGRTPTRRNTTGKESESQIEIKVFRGRERGCLSS